MKMNTEEVLKNSGEAKIAFKNVIRVTPFSPVLISELGRKVCK
jgi:hypothetical protein